MNLVGRWRIIEMDSWDRKAIELLGPGLHRSRPAEWGHFAGRDLSGGGSDDLRPSDQIVGSF